MRINGKVAGIVSSTMVAINVGSLHGVKIGDTARVYRQVDVQDPDSKEELGTVHLTKVNLKVNYVDTRFCIGETVGTVSRGGLAGIYSGFSTFGDAQQIEVTTDRGEAGSGTILIAIGDPVFVEREDKPAEKKGATKTNETPPDKPKAEPTS